MYQPKDLIEAEEKKRKGKKALAEEPKRKKRVSEDDIAEFIKTLKRSEYLVFEQLKKQPTQIFILSLFLSSQTHRDAFLKVLTESHVPKGIATKDIKQIVGQIVETNTITFNENELTLEGTRHVKSLHIAVEGKGMVISRVMDPL